MIMTKPEDAPDLFFSPRGCESKVSNFLHLLLVANASKPGLDEASALRVSYLLAASRGDRVVGKKSFEFGMRSMFLNCRGLHAFAF